MTAKKNILLSKNEALIESWKLRSDYKNYDKSNGSLYNSWRSKIYNSKSKNIGFPKEWKSFDVFNEQIGKDWSKGKLLVRIDLSKPYSVDNCHWVEKGQENINKSIRLDFKGENKFLFEWCVLFKLNYNGVVQRFHKGKNYTAEQILFGKKNADKRKAVCSKTMDEQHIKNKASKMMSSYRNSDLKKGLEFNISRDFLIDTFKKNCVYCESKVNIGLDRINNSIGHIESNCVPCCYRCNVTRLDNFTFDEMILIGKTIKKIDYDRNKKS